MDLAYFLFVIYLTYLTTVDAIRFYVAPNQKKCLREEIHKDVLVTGDYELSDAPGHKSHLIVSIHDGFIVTYYLSIFVEF